MRQSVSDESINYELDEIITSPTSTSQVNNNNNKYWTWAVLFPSSKLMLTMGRPLTNDHLRYLQLSNATLTQTYEECTAHTKICTAVFRSTQDQNSNISTIDDKGSYAHIRCVYLRTIEKMKWNDNVIAEYVNFSFMLPWVMMVVVVILDVWCWHTIHCLAVVVFTHIVFVLHTWSIDHTDTVQCTYLQRHHMPYRTYRVLTRSHCFLTKTTRTIQHNRMYIYTHQPITQHSTFTKTILFPFVVNRHRLVHWYTTHSVLL